MAEYRPELRALHAAEGLNSTANGIFAETADTAIERYHLIKPSGREYNPASMLPRPEGDQPLTARCCWNTPPVAHPVHFARIAGEPHANHPKMRSR